MYVWSYGVDHAAGEGKFMWSEPEIVVVIALGRNEFTQCVLSLFEWIQQQVSQATTTTVDEILTRPRQQLGYSTPWHTGRFLVPDTVLGLLFHRNRSVCHRLKRWLSANQHCQITLSDSHSVSYISQSVAIWQRDNTVGQIIKKHHSHCI